MRTTLVDVAFLLLNNDDGDEDDDILYKYV